MCDDSLRDAGSSKMPAWLPLLGLVVIVCSHTQVTLRHICLRLAGVRLGEIHQVLDVVQYTNKKRVYDSRRLILPTDHDVLTTAVAFDPVAVYMPGELKGKRLFLGDSKFDILDNTATHILLRADPDELAQLHLKKRRYKTGYREPGALVRLALRVPAVNATMGDAALGVLVLALGIWILRRKKWGELKPPPLMAVLLLGACLCSLIQPLRLFDTSMLHPNIRRGVKELIQYFEVFVVAWVALSCVFADRDDRKMACWAFGLGAGFIVLLGMIEYVAVFKGWTLHGLYDVMEIDSLLGFRFNPRRAWMIGSESSKNILASYLLVVLPFLTGLVMACKNKLWRYALGICIAFGLCLVLHTWLLICVLAACLMVLMLDGRPRVVATGVAIGLIAVTAVCMINSRHAKFLLDSVAVRRTQDTFGLIPMPAKGQKFKGDRAWQQKFAERQACMNALGFSPFLGIGIGNYQSEINQFYASAKVAGHSMEKSPQNLMEHDSHSLYQVQAVETGVVGLVLLFLLLAVALAKALRTWHATEDPVDKAICAGAAGTILALIVGSAFSSFLTRGIQLIAIAIIVLPYAIDRASECCRRKA